MSAAKRFYAELAVESTDGKWIQHVDYLALRNALREALDGWLDYAQGLDAEDWGHKSFHLEILELKAKLEMDNDLVSRRTE